LILIFNLQASEKLAAHISSVCRRIGYFKMPFAFAICPVFNSSLVLEKAAMFSPLYRQVCMHTFVIDFLNTLPLSYVLCVIDTYEPLYVLVFIDTNKSIYIINVHMR